jgi:hypothetical protein
MALAAFNKPLAYQSRLAKARRSRDQGKLLLHPSIKLGQQGLIRDKNLYSGVGERVYLIYLQILASLIQFRPGVQNSHYPWQGLDC